MKKSSNLPVLVILILLALGGLVLLTCHFFNRKTPHTAPTALNRTAASVPSQEEYPPLPLSQPEEELKEIAGTAQQDAIAETIPAQATEVSAALAPEQISAQEPPAWTDTDCNALTIPPQNFGPLTCRQSQQAWCAFFENGRPYYCQNTEGTLVYLANKWASSQTLRHLDANGKLILENYYANGQLSRTQETNSGVTTQLWWDSAQLRLTQTDAQTGRTLNKFYFRQAAPFVQYPGGNDMGEINGEWELKDGKIFLDGAYFYTLPPQTPAPDVCALFSGVCASAKTQSEQELL